MNTAIADTGDGQKFVVGATALKRWARFEEIQGAAMCLASSPPVAPPNARVLQR
jgi:hypothetical protein